MRPLKPEFAQEWYWDAFAMLNSIQMVVPRAFLPESFPSGTSSNDCADSSGTALRIAPAERALLLNKIADVMERRGEGT